MSDARQRAHHNPGATRRRRARERNCHTPSPRPPPPSPSPSPSPAVQRCAVRVLQRGRMFEREHGRQRAHRLRQDGTYIYVHTAEPTGRPTGKPIDPLAGRLPKSPPHDLYHHPHTRARTPRPLSPPRSTLHRCVSSPTTSVTTPSQPDDHHKIRTITRPSPSPLTITPHHRPSSLHLYTCVQVLLELGILQLISSASTSTLTAPPTRPADYNFKIVFLAPIKVT